MESIGDKLKSEREQKGYSIEQIARDTNIAKRYLEALEAEDFSVFPGDPYLVGFLRNYSDYLGIDPDEMVRLYNNFKIQSQPLPMNELLVKRDRKPLVLGLLIAAAAVILGVSGYFLVPRIVESAENRKARREAALPEETAGGTVYSLEDEMIERRFLEKDVVSIPHKNQTYEIQLTDISDRLTLTVPGGTHILRVGDERAIDLDGDANMDIKVALNDLDPEAKNKSAVLRFDMFVKATGLETPPLPDGETASFEPTRELGGAGVESRVIEPTVLVQADQAEPFAVDIIFRGYCLFRYLIDGREREEQYFLKGDTIVLDVTKEVRLWISNAGNLIAKVAGQEVVFGRPGEVSARAIGWTKNEESGRDTLLMQAVY